MGELQLTSRARHSQPEMAQDSTVNANKIILVLQMFRFI